MRMSETDRSDPITIGLQQLFAPLAAEAIPDEFLALLDRFDANARGTGALPDVGGSRFDDDSVGGPGADR